jgi:diketogulonate reductase-like aldo/keto reductase
MHWPSPFKSGDNFMPKDENDKMIVGDSDYVDTYKAMEELQKKGKARAIGISNFSKAELERLLKETSIVSHRRDALTVGVLCNPFIILTLRLQRP